MVRLARAAHASVVLLGMRMPPNYGPEYTAQFQRAYRDVAKARVAFLPFFLDDVAMTPASDAGRRHTSERPRTAAYFSRMFGRYCGLCSGENSGGPGSPVRRRSPSAAMAALTWSATRRRRRGSNRRPGGSSRASRCRPCISRSHPPHRTDPRAGWRTGGRRFGSGGLFALLGLRGFSRFSAVVRFVGRFVRFSALAAFASFRRLRLLHHAAVAAARAAACRRRRRTVAARDRTLREGLMARQGKRNDRQQRGEIQKIFFHESHLPGWYPRAAYCNAFRRCR